MADDLDLVESAQTGDADAFEVLMERYKPRLTRFLFRYVRDLDDTDDVVQETFIKAYLAINNFRGDSSFATWIFTIGTNTAKYHLVKRTRRGPRISEPLGDEGEGRLLFDAEVDFDTPETKLENKEILALLDHVLEALPAEQRMSFELRELEGLSYEEIAGQMHCPVGTVRSRIHRARDTLAAALKGH